MASNAIKALAVVGAGQMGSGIAQIIATAGLEVSLIDKSKVQLEIATRAIQASVEKLSSKGKLQEDSSSILSRLATTTDTEVLSTADFIIEAVPEIESLKSSVFHAADVFAPPHAIIATNTSSISVTRLASTTSRPDRVIGMHFMNPPPLMALVEIIRGMGTNDDTFATTLDLAKRLGKSTCVSADRPGFIVNRVLMPMINEAFFALMEGVGSAQDIDLGMKLGTNQPMGPLMLADFIGLDTCLSIMRVLHKHLGDDKYRPCPLLSQYVDAGWFGKKAGRGVYTYEKESV